MKRLYLILLLTVVTLSSLAQNIGEAFYVYRSDGQFNVFVRDEVESMEYSYEDADGNSFDELVTQIITTADSVYKIPLAVIDSISFVTPETQYKPGVIVIEGALRQYVLSCDELQITFSSAIPYSLLPRIGDKLVTLEQSHVFPSGFLGEVASVDKNADGNYFVSCELISMTDVFKCYYGVYETNFSQSSHPTRIAHRTIFQPDVTFQPGPFHFALTDDWSARIGLNNQGFAYVYRPYFTLDYSPTMRVRAFIIVPNQEHSDMYISLTTHADFHLEEQIGGSGTLQWIHDWGWTDTLGRPRLSWPIPQCPLITFYLEPGIFLRAASTISSQINLSQDFRLIFHYDVSAYNGSSMQPTLRLIPVDFSVSGQLSLKGSVALGGYAEMGFLIADKRFAHICFRGEAGVELTSNAVLMTGDLAEAMTSTRTYDWLSENSLNFNWFIGTRIEGLSWAYPVTHAYNFPLGRRETIASLDHVPTFSNVSLEYTDFSTLEAQAEVRGELLQPVNVGFGLYDDDGRLVDSYFAETQYQNRPSLLNHTFTGLGGGKEYTVHPLVRYNGTEMMASPSSKAEVKEFPVKIIKFEQLSSRHNEDGYVYNSRTYHYRYNGAITAEITDSEGIVDWGYVFEGPDGVVKHISLSKLGGTTCTDISCICYGDKTSDEVIIYGYVKYCDNSQYYYGEEEIYQLTYEDDGLPVKITDFHQDASDYSEQGFNYEGRNYSYKYYCTVTVELLERKDIEDWGYVYEDPYGNPPTRISLQAYGSPYKDMRYAYYRNESSSVVTLYEYVKYVGDREYYYGEPQNYQVMYKADDIESNNFEISLEDLYANEIFCKCSINEIGNVHLHPVIYVSANKENMKSYMVYAWNGMDFTVGSLLNGGNNGRLQPSTTYYVQPAIVDDARKDIVRYKIYEFTTLPHYSVQKPRLQQYGWFYDNGYKGYVILDFDIIDNSLNSDIHDEFDVTYNVEQAGIYYNTSGNPGPSNAVFVAAPQLSEDCSSRSIGGRMTIHYVQFDNLSTTQTYYFRGMYKKGGITYYGDVFSYDWSGF